MKRVVVTIFMILVLGLTACSKSADIASSEENQEVYVVEEKVIEPESEKEPEVVEESIEEIEDESVAMADKQTIDKMNAMDGMFTSDDFRVIIRGVEVLFEVDINDLLEALGEPDSHTSARSCMEDGEEHRYVYDGYAINTYPNGEKNIIYLIEFDKDAVTDANIGIGSQKVDVEKAYGSTCTQMGDSVIYELDMDHAMTIKYDGDKVNYIDMYYK